MDVQAKVRLTGAVILVVLLVLVVPELLSGPGPRVAAVAPRSGEEPPLRSYTVELGDARHALSPSTSAATPPELAAPAQPSGPVASVPPEALAAPAQATKPPEPEKAAVQAPLRQQTPVKAPAAGGANAAPPESAPPPGGWTVQLGSFASRANAARLVRDLNSRGYAAFLTESAGGGHKLYRVRVGPAANHAAAETLAAQLRAAGHPGSLTQRP